MLPVSYTVPVHSSVQILFNCTIQYTRYLLVVSHHQPPSLISSSQWGIRHIPGFQGIGWWEGRSGQIYNGKLLRMLWKNHTLNLISSYVFYRFKNVCLSRKTTCEHHHAHLRIMSKNGIGIIQYKYFLPMSTGFSNLMYIKNEYK
jgi:hypothetical protein